MTTFASQKRSKQPGTSRAAGIFLLVFCIVCVSTGGTRAGKPQEKPSGGELGRIEGQIRLVGAVPVPGILEKLANGLVVPDESLLVDPTGRGVENVYVYLKNAPTGAAMLPAPEEPVTIRIVGKRLVPHVTAVRVGQTLRAVNLDPETNHIKLQPVRNSGVDWLLDVGMQQELKYQNSERLPVSAVSNLFPQMRGWMLVLDHPWFAITDSEGRFEIEGLPPGHHEFIVWHEKFGYLDRKRIVDIAAGRTTSMDVEFDLAHFREKVAEFGVRFGGPLRERDARTAGPFDIEQPGNGDDVVAGRQLLQLKLAEKLNRLDQRVHLTEEQRKKLELAGAGDIEHLLEDVRIARDQFRGIKTDAERSGKNHRVQLPELRERFSTGLFGPDSLVGKLQNSVLTPAQHDRLKCRSLAPAESSSSSLRSSVTPRPKLCFACVRLSH